MPDKTVERKGGRLVVAEIIGRYVSVVQECRRCMFVVDVPRAGGGVGQAGSSTFAVQWQLVGLS